MSDIIYSFARPCFPSFPTKTISFGTILPHGHPRRTPSRACHPPRAGPKTKNLMADSHFYDQPKDANCHTMAGKDHISHLGKVGTIIFYHALAQEIYAFPGGYISLRFLETYTRCFLDPLPWYQNSILPKKGGKFNNSAGKFYSSGCEWRPSQDAYYVWKVKVYRYHAILYRCKPPGHCYWLGAQDILWLVNLPPLTYITPAPPRNKAL